MSNTKDDITYFQDCWQKLIAIDPDFKDISIPQNHNKKEEIDWYKNKFSSIYEWGKSVRRTPNEWSNNCQSKAEKIVELVDEMKEKNIL